MKTIIGLLIILFLSSITYRVRPKDCGCQMKVVFYNKGKIIQITYGTIFSQKDRDEIADNVNGKLVLYDSVVVKATN